MFMQETIFIDVHGTERVFFRLLIPVKAFVRGVNFQSVWNLLVFQVFKWLDKIYEKYLKRSSSVKTKPSSSGLKAPFIKLESVSR